MGAKIIKFYREEFRISHRDDALNLIGEMVIACNEFITRGRGVPRLDSDMEIAICSPHYFKPRLEAIGDAIRRGIV